VPRASRPTKLNRVYIKFHGRSGTIAPTKPWLRNTSISS